VISTPVAVGLLAFCLGAEPEVVIRSGHESPLTGRVIVVFAPLGDPAPLEHAGHTGMDTPAMVGVDARNLTRGETIRIPSGTLRFPQGTVADLPAGQYSVQAVIHKNPDINLPLAPGNVRSKPVAWIHDPQDPKPVELVLSEVISDKLPPETERVKWVILRSELLSRFFGRDMFHRAAVILPPQFVTEPPARFPLVVRIGGFGSRFTSAISSGHPNSPFQRAMAKPDAVPMVMIHLDGAGPWGDPYHVNSANNGPMGDALTTELIPEIEKRFRSGGKPAWRFTEGHSTGGWVSLALQVFHPEFFGGCWSHCPDPVDFRDFEVLNIYSEPNAYINRFGFERPAMRTTKGDIQYTLRHEVLVERVLGRGGRWELGGKDWSSWNATFGPRGADGFPVPLWDGATGKINPTVAAHFRKYDIRNHLETNWTTLAPKLSGKIRVFSGELDEYYLNNAVHRLDDFLKTATPSANAKIVFGPTQGHSFRGHSDEEMFAEMGQTAMGQGR
jgi:hypothetical protein